MIHKQEGNEKLIAYQAELGEILPPLEDGRANDSLILRAKALVVRMAELEAEVTRLTRRIALADAVCAMAENFEMIPTPTWGMRMIDAVEAYRASAQDAPESHLLAAARKQDADPDRIRTPRDVQELYDTDAPDTAREGGK